MRTYAPNPNFIHIKEKIWKRFRRHPYKTEKRLLVFRDFDDMTRAVIEGSVFTDRTPETDHPEICPE